MIYYIIKNKAQINFLFFSVFLIFKLLIIYAIIIIFVFSYFFTLCHQFITTIEVKYVLFCTFIKLLLLYIV